VHILKTCDYNADPGSYGIATKFAKTTSRQPARTVILGYIVDIAIPWHKHVDRAPLSGSSDTSPRDAFGADAADRRQHELTHTEDKSLSFEPNQYTCRFATVSERTLGTFSEADRETSSALVIRIAAFLISTGGARCPLRSHCSAVITLPPSRVHHAVCRFIHRINSSLIRFCRPFISTVSLV